VPAGRVVGRACSREAFNGDAPKMFQPNLLARRARHPETIGKES
jgi:hypothetical protein